MDKYDAVNDHYCYTGMSTLKNKLNIKIWVILKNGKINDRDNCEKYWI